MTAPPAPMPATTTDQFLGGRLTIRQPQRGYRAGIDAVLLAATCNATAATDILDCGAGVGTVGLCVARRLPLARVTLVERQPAYAALARANIEANGLTDRATVIEADLTAPLAQVPELARRSGTFDQAFANPPYVVDSDGTRAPDGLKDAANAMPASDLDAWARFAAAMLRPSGTLTVIHRADALPALFAVLDRRFGALQLRFIHPRAAQPANRVLLRAVKGSRAPLQVRPPLIAHQPDGQYEMSFNEALRHAAAIDL